MTHRQQFGQMVKDYMTKHNLFELGWQYSYDKAKRRLGQCCYGPKLITFSLPFIDANQIHVMENTVKHEIAHALVGAGVGHGIVWQRKAIEIGARPERCASDPNIKRPIGPYMFLCNCGPTYYYRNDRLHRQFKCCKCKTVSTVVHTSTLVSNS